MTLVESGLRNFLFPVIDQAKPYKRSQDPALEREWSSIPVAHQHLRSWDRTEPRQLFRGLPVAATNRQRPERDTDILLRPRAEQASGKVAQIKPPEGDLRQQCD